MGMLKVYAEIMDEVPRLEKDYGLGYHAAVRKAKEIYKDELKKAQSLATKQGKEPNKIINAILTDKVEIDNGELYFDEIGETIGEL